MQPVPGTRERLITATNEQFRRQGYHGTSLKAVTSAAGATIGSLYHFFPGGKDELAAVALEESGATYLELFHAIAAEAGDTVSAVSAFFDGAAEALEATDFVEICPIGTVAREIASTNEPLRLATDRVFSSWTDAFSGLLRRDGVDDATAASLAAMVVASIEGGFLLARASRDGHALRAIGGHVASLVERELSAVRAGVGSTNA
jgi:AcrR family transcriptional regulator